MRKTALGGLLGLLTVSCLMADETPILQIQTSSATAALPFATVRSITFDGETSMIIHTDSETVTYPIADIVMITFRSGTLPADSTTLPTDTLVIPTDTIEVPTDTIEVPTDTIVIPTDTTEVDTPVIPETPTDTTTTDTVAGGGEVTLLLHLQADERDAAIRVYGVGGRLLRQYPNLEALKSDLRHLPAGIYLIEADGKTSKYLKP
jgi:hypothetical protein